MLPAATSTKSISSGMTTGTISANLGISPGIAIPHHALIAAKPLFTPSVREPDPSVTAYSAALSVAPRSARHARVADSLTATSAALRAVTGGLVPLDREEAVGSDNPVPIARGLDREVGATTGLA